MIEGSGGGGAQHTVHARNSSLARAATHPRALIAAWLAASTAAGWAFPDDWWCPEVDRAARAAFADGAPGITELTELGAARCAAGVTLEEALTDLAALREVLRAGVNAGAGVVGRACPDDVPSSWIRHLACGWSDAASAHLGEHEHLDAGTGLVTASYLHTRLGEVYREAAATGRSAGQRWSMVVLTLDATGLGHWNGMAQMTLAADCLRQVFDAGETRALLRGALAVVLTPRSPALPGRVAMLRSKLAAAMAGDDQLQHEYTARVWCEAMPATHGQAHSLLRRLGGR